MADDKLNIGPEAEKPGEAPQEKKAEPVKDTPPTPEQPAPGAAEDPVVETAPKAQPAPTVESQPEEKAAPAPKVLDFSAAKNKAPGKEATEPEKKPAKEHGGNKHASRQQTVFKCRAVSQTGKESLSGNVPQEHFDRQNQVKQQGRHTEKAVRNLRAERHHDDRQRRPCRRNPDT